MVVEPEPIPTDKKILSQKEALKKIFGTFYDEMLGIITKNDPIGIAMVPDEYEPEVEAILPRMESAESETALRDIIYHVFVRLFDSKIAGPESRYDAIARDTWAAWCRHRDEIDSSLVVICPDCEGGKMCDTCEGTGKWESKSCPFCGGNGVCYHCGGRGFITEWD